VDYQRDEWLTASEIAKLLKVNKTTVIRLFGDLPGVILVVSQFVSQMKWSMQRPACRVCLQNQVCAHPLCS
jgi:ADP-dependent phosphofructokinase/glucokinase